MKHITSRSLYGGMCAHHDHTSGPHTFTQRYASYTFALTITAQNKQWFIDSVYTFVILVFILQSTDIMMKWIKSSLFTVILYCKHYRNICWIVYIYRIGKQRTMHVTRNLLLILHSNEINYGDFSKKIPSLTILDFTTYHGLWPGARESTLYCVSH